jgi:hypothetical protein
VCVRACLCACIPRRAVFGESWLVGCMSHIYAFAYIYTCVCVRACLCACIPRRAVFGESWLVGCMSRICAFAYIYTHVSVRACMRRVCVSSQTSYVVLS